jgi:hypothetical protein
MNMNVTKILLPGSFGQTKEADLVHSIVTSNINPGFDMVNFVRLVGKSEITQLIVQLDERVVTKLEVDGFAASSVGASFGDVAVNLLE